MSMTVSKLAKAAGVNLETVRFYERKRLLPKPDRTSGGHRLYSPDDIERLRFIQRAKFVGFTLREIAVLARLRDEPERKLRRRDGSRPPQGGRDRCQAARPARNAKCPHFVH